MSVCLINSVDIEDGLGAQLQRRLEIYYLAQHLRIGYHFLQIVNFDSNYGDGMQTIQEKDEATKQIANLVPFLTHKCIFRKHLEVDFLSKKIEKLGWRNMCIALRVLNSISNFFKIHLLIRLSNPHKLKIDREIIFQNITNIEPNLKEEDFLQIVIHLPWARANLLPDRKIPIEWYLDILESIIAFIEEYTIRYRITIHTDAMPNLDSDKKQIWTSNATQKYWKESGNKNFITNSNYSFLDIEELFKKYSNLEVIVNVNPIRVWNDMANGNILILSNSSLSHVGAIIANKCSLAFIPNRNPYPMQRLIPINLDLSNIDVIRRNLINKFKHIM